MDEVRWGSIGCGDVMEVKSGPALQRVEHSILHAVMRRDGELARDFAQRHGVPQAYDSAKDLIHDPNVNAIYIATPPSTHLEYTLMAAAANKPAYVEKPMAMDHAECLQMIQACEAADVPLFVAYYRRTLPRYLKVLDLIRNGTIGELESVDMQLLHPASQADKAGEDNWRVQPAIAGCGYFCDLASHMFDLIQFFFGEISEVEGKSWNSGGYYDAEDQVRASFQFGNGLSGEGTWDFDAEKRLDRTTIHGSQGRLSFSFFDEATVTLSTASGTEVFDIPNPKHIQQPLIQTIVAELLGQGSCPSTGRTAAATNLVMERILKKA